MVPAQRWGRWLGVLIVLGLLTQAQGRQPDKDGWVDLLAGGDLSKHWTTAGNWKLGSDGVLALEPRKGETGWQRFDAYLWSKKQYTNFEAEFEYKVAKGGNSGFYIHVGDVKDPVNKGIEVQVYDSYGNKGKLTDHDSGGIIPGIPPTKNTSKPTGEWNHMRVTVKGGKVTVELNGEVVNDVPLDSKTIKNRPPSGYVGIQDHGMPLWFRNVKIRELQ
jgi:hypothetical protein